MKTIIITGAANGVGKEIAKLLKGNKLILIDEDKKNLEKIGKEISASYYVCDVSESKNIKTTMKQILEENKKIDTLINCAGMWASGEVSNMNTPKKKKMNELSRLQKVVATNTFGSMAMIAVVYPIMEKSGGGQIVNIVSQAAVEEEPFAPVYEASKKGAYAFRKAIQVDLAKHNIKITDICPGLIKTNLFAKAGDLLPKKVMDTGLEPEEVAKAVKYVLDMPHEITVPSLEIRNIKNY